jgi:hypothetical protein
MYINNCIGRGVQHEALDARCQRASVTTNHIGGLMYHLSQNALRRLSHVLLVLLLFNVVAFASQACAAGSVSSASIDASGAPCDEEDESCLADMFENDGTLRSRLTVFPQGVPPTQPLVMPVAPEQRLSFRWQAWSRVEPPIPLRLQVCKLLF